MRLNAREVLRHLQDIGVTHLHHANTVGTACTYLKHGGLLSRGGVAALNGFQTWQKTDDLDKELGIWDDIFLDNVDIHDRRRQENFYGPVLFRFNVELLASETLPPLWITKENPTNWGQMSPEDWYYGSISEFRSEYSKGDFFRMITLRSTLDVLPFDPYLEDIIVDDPSGRLGEEETFGQACQALIRAAEIGGVDPDLLYVRECSSDCNCYADQPRGKMIERYFNWGTRY